MRTSIRKIICTLAFVLLFAPTFLAQTETFIEPSEGRLAFSRPFYSQVGSLPYDFDSVRDIVIDDETIYVVDSNGIVVFNPDGTGLIIGEDVVEDPQGLFIEGDELYLADKKAATVFVFNKSGELLRQYDKPDEVFFGEDTAYAPIDVVVSDTDIIYIASEGTSDGLISLKMDGTFLNFYGANTANESFYSNLIANNDLLPNSIKPKPASITNVEIDNDSVVYTMTQNVKSGVRKLNYDGNNVYESPILEDSVTTVDFVLDKYENAFVINDGYIEVYNPQGELLFKFTDDTIGSPLQIAVSGNEELYVYDGDRIIYFQPTENATLLYEAADLYYAGKLDEAKALWDEFLKSQTSYALAFQSLGDYEYQNREYAAALDMYENAASKEDYSDAMFFVRQNFVEDNIGYIIGLLVLLCITISVYKRFISNKVKAAVNKVKLLEDCHYVKKVLTDPKLVFYEMKYKDKFGYIPATTIYILAILTMIIYINFSSFLFEPMTSFRISNGSYVLIFIVVVAVVVLTNQFVSTVMFTEARLGEMYRAFSLVFVPFILLSNINVVVGYGLTLNEQVIYTVIMVVMYLWMFVILYNALSEMHNYQIGSTYKNIFVTIFTIIVLLFVAITATYLIVTMFNAVYQVITEVI